MQITFFSLFMSVIWSSALAVFNHFCRKKHFFIRQLGVTNILFLYLFSMIRLIVPYEFSFTRVIAPSETFHEFYEKIYTSSPQTTQISLQSVFVTVWITVSVVLIARFVFQYTTSMKKFSTYRIRKDEQCKRIFNRVLNVSRIQLNIDIRSNSDINIPMGMGIFRNRYILLPEEEYSDSELYYILRHEYTHFQNRDLLIKVLIHIYSCIFWWNPAIYLLKKDLAQILEIKCDLDVTNRMANQNKVQYLTTIVAMLKNAGAKRKETAFYGTTALVSKNYQSEIIERFKLVSASYNYKKKNILFTGSWFLIFSMIIFLSYSFVVRPDYRTSMDEIGTKEEIPGSSTGTAYTIECVDDTYYVHFRNQ
ncbi:MAG: M56 family metallopeptidase [Lachnospiraceae bacterium]|nr:M56 family metallopeptidase [Lachnospiraceae bacterium]